MRQRHTSMRMNDNDDDYNIDNDVSDECGKIISIVIK